MDAFENSTDELRNVSQRPKSIHKIVHLLGQSHTILKRSKIVLTLEFQDFGAWIEFHLKM